MDKSLLDVRCINHKYIVVERYQGTEEADWLIKISRELETEQRMEFEAAHYKHPLEVAALSIADEKAYVKSYLSAYLPIIPSTVFVEACKTNIDTISQKIEETFRLSVPLSCYRPLYLSIFTEVWISKEGKLILNSIEELLSEYLNKEKKRWRLILTDDALVNSYLRLLSMACAIGCFNITDVYGENYLEEDAKKITAFLDGQSGKPGGENTFTDLFVHMEELVEDDGEDSIADIFIHPESIGGRMEEAAAYILSMDVYERFAYFSPYIKLCADPNEMYLQMLANAGVADAEELVELQRVREKQKKRVEALPDHAWIIEPEFPDIIKEYMVSYTVNDRDIGRFTKLARSNSILGLSDFITRALDDWKEKSIFQKMVVTPPAEVLNYFEYYVSLLVSLNNVNDLKTVEQVLIDSTPCFSKYEMELWRRISIVLAERGDVEQLYDSSCRFIQYIYSIDGIVHICEEVADAVESYSVGLHNGSAVVEHADFLNKFELISEKVPENKRLGEVLCYSYCFLINSKLYHSKNADISVEWDKIKGIIKRYGYQETICKNSMKAAHDYMITLIQKNNLNLLRQLTEFVEEIYSHCHIVEIADVAAGYQ